MHAASLKKPATRGTVAGNRGRALLRAFSGPLVLSGNVIEGILTFQASFKNGYLKGADKRNDLNILEINDKLLRH